MLKINGYTAEYHHLYIYDDDSNILFQTQRPYQLDLNIIADVRSARKLMFNKKDCFEIKTQDNRSYLFGNN